MNPSDQAVEGPLTLPQLRTRHASARPLSVVALGTFDGVHQGHQAILHEALHQKRRLVHQTPHLDAEAVVFTFDKLPLEVLRPERAPSKLLSTDARNQRILDNGIDRVVMARFDEAFAVIDPEAFVQDVLLGAFNLGAVVVGFNHTFGRGGKGDTALLQRICHQHGVHVSVVGGVSSGGEVVSSTLIRGLLLDGKCEKAAQLMGAPFFLEGLVVDGEKQGRLLGYPTANLQPMPRLLIPADGVYLTRVESEGLMLGHALTVVSDRPTFAGMTYSIESHVLDYAGDLYDKQLRVHFLGYLRPIARFAGPDELIRQIRADVDDARKRIAQM